MKSFLKKIYIIFGMTFFSICCQGKVDITECISSPADQTYVFGSDNNYFFPAMVSINSLISNLSLNKKVRIIFLVTDDLRNNTNRLNGILSLVRNKKNLEIVFWNTSKLIGLLNKEQTSLFEQVRSKINKKWGQYDTVIIKFLFPTIFKNEKLIDAGYLSETFATELANGPNLKSRYAIPDFLWVDTDTVVTGDTESCYPNIKKCKQIFLTTNFDRRNYVFQKFDLQNPVSECEYLDEPPRFSGGVIFWNLDHLYNIENELNKTEYLGVLKDFSDGNHADEDYYKLLINHWNKDRNNNNKIQFYLDVRLNFLATTYDLVVLLQRIKEYLISKSENILMDIVDLWPSQPMSTVKKKKDVERFLNALNEKNQADYSFDAKEDHLGISFDIFDQDQEPLINQLSAIIFDNAAMKTVNEIFPVVLHWDQIEKPWVIVGRVLAFNNPNENYENLSVEKFIIELKNIEKKLSASTQIWLDYFIKILNNTEIAKEVKEEAKNWLISFFIAWKNLIDVLQNKNSQNFSISFAKYLEEICEYSEISKKLGASVFSWLDEFIPELKKNKEMEDEADKYLKAIVQKGNEKNLRKTTGN